MHYLNLCISFLSDSFKNTDLYKTALAEKDYLKYDCFDYIHQLEDRRDSLDENGKYLISEYKQNCISSQYTVISLFIPFVNNSTSEVTKF